MMDFLIRIVQLLLKTLGRSQSRLVKRKVEKMKFDKDKELGSFRGSLNSKGMEGVEKKLGEEFDLHTPLSKHFSLEEMVRSDYATRNDIDNTPTSEVIEELKYGCQDVLDVIEDQLESPLFVSSGFRCFDLNKGIGGSQSSQHVKGQAADVTTKKMSVAELFEFIRVSGVPFDQLIEEFGKWVHISWRKENPRGQTMLARRVDGETVYSHV